MCSRKILWAGQGICRFLDGHAVPDRITSRDGLIRLDITKALYLSEPDGISEYSEPRPFFKQAIPYHNRGLSILNFFL
jgi:hypothetical protein